MKKTRWESLNVARKRVAYVAGAMFVLSVMLIILSAFLDDGSGWRMVPVRGMSYTEGDGGLRHIVRTIGAVGLFGSFVVGGAGWYFTAEVD